MRRSTTVDAEDMRTQRTTEPTRKVGNLFNFENKGSLREGCQSSEVAEAEPERMRASHLHYPNLALLWARERLGLVMGLSELA